MTANASRSAIFLWLLLFCLTALTGTARAATYSLLVSTSPDRANPSSLEGAGVNGPVYIFLGPDTGISRVSFFLDDPNMTGTPKKVERVAPYDFAGTATDGSAYPYDTAQLSAGTHTVTARVTLSAGGGVTVGASFSVGSSTAQDIDQVHLAWIDAPSTTLTVVWRTRDASAASTLQYRKAGETAWQTVNGAVRPSGTTGALHEVTLTGLTSATAYEYRIWKGGADSWSDTYTTRTAPPKGPADFDAVFFADTGLVGRLDGLATGTQQIIDEIAALNPLLVLPGGDLAYFNTDKRFATLDDAIDAWFNQMQPVGSRAPMMPAYGNHEALLGEGFAPWAARFPTPTGFDSRRNFSFDVGDVHFVSIFAVYNTKGLPSATLSWIESDIVAARNAGARWIIPYFHVAPFSDGTNHPSNLALRSQLGPLFERLGVHVVLAAHDQSYERTYPLVDVPSTNTPTSTDLRCYTTADGVSWVKISPAGKLSNISGGFSPFATNPPPPWTAYRDNTMHHFARLVFAAEGTLNVYVYGVKGDGSPPVIQDSFRYTTGSCTSNGLLFDPVSVGFDLSPGEQATATTLLTSQDGSSAGYTLTDDADWLSVSPASGNTPGALTISVDSTGLPAGTHTGTVRASSGGTEASLPVTLRVAGLLVSTAANRSNPAPLDGATTAGNIYVFTTPDDGVYRVSFFLDNPLMTGTPTKVENQAPYDFAGTARNRAALPYDTGLLANGVHTITARIELTNGGTRTVEASFTVDNGP